MNDQENNKIKLKDEIKGQTVGYILTALGLVAGLAWNEAIKDLIDRLFPLGDNSIFAKFFYAIILTVIIVFVSTKLLKITKRNN